MKKKTVPKFLLAQNDKAKSSNQFIVHTQEPAFIAEVIHFKSASEREAFLSNNNDEVIVVNASNCIVIRKKFDTEVEISDYIKKRIVYWFLNV